MRRTRRTSALLAFAALAIAACDPPRFPRPNGGGYAPITARAPLPSGERVLALPTGADDAKSMLGKILVAPHDPRRPLAEQLSPNPCAEELVDIAPQNIGDTLVEDADSLGPSDGSSDAATYVYYRFRSREVLEKGPTAAYRACCAKEDCGIGYVRALTKGEGEIALATPTMPGGDADIALDDFDRPLELELLERRKVRGYVAFRLGPDIVSTEDSMAQDEHPAFYDDDLVTVRESPIDSAVFQLCTRYECLTDSQFISRYRELTGETELDELDQDYALPWIILSSVVAGLGAGTAIGGAVATRGALDDEQKLIDGKEDQLMAGAVAVGAGLTFMMSSAFLLAGAADTPNQHSLTKEQARRFAERYNRALEKKAASRRP